MSSNKSIPVEIKFGAVDNVSPVLGSLTVNIRGLTKKFETLNETAKKLTFQTTLLAINSVNHQLKDFSNNLSLAARGTIHDVSNLEDNTNRIHILMGKSADTKFFNSLKEQWKSISEISNYSQSELSDVSKNIVSSGVIKQEDILNLTKSSALLADASKREIDAVEAFQLLNEFKNTYRIKASGIDKLTDQIAYGKDQGNASFHDIKESFKYAAPVLGATTNTDVADFMALTAVLSAHGIKGSNLGTAIRKIPIQLVPKLDPRSIKRMEDAGLKDDVLAAKINDKGHNGILETLHLGTEDITDKETGLINLNKALLLIRDNLNKIPKSQHLSILKQLYGTEPISAGLTLTKFLDEYFKTRAIINSNESIGKAAELANSTRNTLESKINEFKNARDNLKTSLMQTRVNDSLKYIVDKFKSMTEYINSANSGWKEFLGMTGLVGYGALQFSAKLAPLLLNMYLLHSFFKGFRSFGFVSKLITRFGFGLFIASGFLKTFIGLAWRIPFVFLTTGIYALTVAFWKLAASVLADPLTWIVLAIIAALAALGFAIYSIVRHWEYLKTSVVNVLDFIRDYAKDFSDDLIGLFKHPFQSLIKGFVDSKSLIAKIEKSPSVLSHFVQTMTFMRDDKKKEDFSLPNLVKDFFDVKMFLEKHRPTFLDFNKKENSLNKVDQNKSSSHEVNFVFNGLPAGTKVIQKTKNTPPANVKTGLMGGSLQ